MSRRHCGACGSHTPRGGFERAHFFSDGSGGCMCKQNMLDLCKYPCHRDIVHGINGGWRALIKLWPNLKPLYALAVAHMRLRSRGLGCGMKTKVGQLARMRQAAAL